MDFINIKHKNGETLINVNEVQSITKKQTKLTINFRTNSKYEILEFADEQQCGIMYRCLVKSVFNCKTITDICGGIDYGI